LRFAPDAVPTGGAAVLINILTHWTSAVYYIVSEIYSSVSIGLLFWQFANDVVSVPEAQRFYPLFAQMSGLAPIVAGQYMVHYTSQAASFTSSMHRLTGAVSVAGIMICFLYHQTNQFVQKQNAAIVSDEKAPKKKAKKPKLSMKESIQFLAGSQYLRLVSMLVLGYGLSINFTEIMWKSLVKRKYPVAQEYQRFMGNFSSAVGFATCIVIFFGVQVIRILGWRVGAMATPTVMALLAFPFFVCILAGVDDNPAALTMAVWLGTLQSLLSKTAKYALFDPTTQMAYIPLDEDSKVKGKAAIDVLGSRIGKSGGSLIQQGLVFLFGNILHAAPVVAVIFYGVLGSWIVAAQRLSTLFQAQTELAKAEQQEEEQAHSTSGGGTVPATMVSPPQLVPPDSRSKIQ
jgi:ATP:ADP antiporter, AAA family